MSFCSFSRDAAMFDVTPIENEFLMEYLPTAPEGFLRVYLYARMVCAHPELGGELKELAKALRMEEDEVLNAMQYWERQGLAEKLSDHPASYALFPLHGSAVAQSQAEREYYEYREYNSSLQELFGEADLLEPRQYKLANDWLNVLGFTQEAALRLLAYELSQPGGRKPAAVFKRADKRAIEWAERGIHSIEDVERAISYDERVYEMAAAALKQLAIGRRPTGNELDCVRRWIDDWGLTMKDVLSACEQTTKSRAPSIAYLDAILKARVESGSGEHFEAMKLVLRELGAVNTIPTPEQTRAYAKLMEQGFAPETVRLAAVQCARKRRHSFEDLDWMLRSWGDAGVRTQDEAQRYIADMQRNTAEVRALLEAAGLSRRPNMDDLELYEGWKRVHSPEMIRCAAELSRGARVPVKYMDKLLANWAQSGIATPEAARAESERRAKKMSSPQGGAPAGADYLEHDYSEMDFGKDFFYDLDRDHPEGGGDQ